MGVAFFANLSARLFMASSEWPFTQFQEIICFVISLSFMNFFTEHPKDIFVFFRLAYGITLNNNWAVWGLSIERIQILNITSQTYLSRIFFTMFM